jgi:predicted HTH transcriptional regulator
MAEAPVNQQRFDELVAQPSESLNVELKSWLNLSDTFSKAKLVKAALALRNRNGGFILIGFDDNTRQPLRPPSEMDIAAAFHLDVVQSLVSQFAFEKFEITVGFGERSGVKHPVIAIPEGTRTPNDTPR